MNERGLRLKYEEGGANAGLRLEIASSFVIQDDQGKVGKYFGYSK